MSFIGPRPERPEFVEQLRKPTKNYSVRLKVNPGMTGLAQICCPYDVAIEEKLKYDLIYVKNKGSIRIAWFILHRTVAGKFWRRRRAIMHKVALSIDVEDWFCVRNLSQAIPYERWDACEQRLDEGLDFILEELDRRGILATFFYSRLGGQSKSRLCSQDCCGGT